MASTAETSYPVMIKVWNDRDTITYHRYGIDRWKRYFEDNPDGFYNSGHVESDVASLVARGWSQRREYGNIRDWE